MTVLREAVGVRPRMATAADLEQVIGRLRSQGYRVVGPVVRNGAFTLGDVSSVCDLPAGWRDEQGPGSYRISRGQDGELFGYAVGPHAAKSYLHPPNWTLFRARGGVNGIESSDPA